MRKKILSLLLALCLTFSLCVPVLAEQAKNAPGSSEADGIATPVGESPEAEENGEVTQPATFLPGAEPGSTSTAEPSLTPGGTPSSSPEPALPEDSDTTASPVPVATPESSSPASGSTEDPEETEEAVPAPSPEQDPSLQPEKILQEEQEPALVLTRGNESVTAITVNNKRPVTITVSRQPAAEKSTHITWSSSDSEVATAAGNATNGNTDSHDETLLLAGQSGIVNIYPAGLGTATITGHATTDGEADLTVTLEVTVSGESSTLGKTLSDIQKMSPEEVLGLQVYDGRDLGIMSGVNSQTSGNCVAQGYAAMIETSARKQGFSPDLDLDVKDLTDRFYHHGGDPLGNTEDDGQNLNASSALGVFPLAAFLTTWNGPVPSGTGTNADGFQYNAAKPRDIVFLSSHDIDTIKRYIVQYGAVGFAYNNGGSASSLYYWTGSKSGHYSVLVGWDDTVSASEFGGFSGNIERDGAWIVKDSAGVEAHSTGKGYFYLSYESAMTDHVVFEAMPSGTYRNNYFYDGQVPYVVNDLQFTPLQAGDAVAASFEAKAGTDAQDEYLEAVNIGLETKGEVSLEVEVYTHVKSEALPGTSPDPLAGIAEPSARSYRTVCEGGFYTIPLKSPVKLTKGEYFTVLVRVSGACSLCVSQENSSNDHTYVKKSGGTWGPRANCPARLKAFTNLHTPEEVNLPDLQSLALDKTTLEMTVGTTEQLTVTFTPENARDRSVTWASSDPLVVTVDEYGVLTTVGVGMATVTVTGVNGIQASCTVTVQETPVPVTRVSLNKQALTLTVGQSEKLTATVLPEDATDKTVEWSAEPANVVTVDQEGTVTALATGSATVTASAGGCSAQCAVTVSEQEPTGAPTASPDPSVSAGPTATVVPTEPGPEETAVPPVTSEPFATPAETAIPSETPGENVVLDASSQSGAPQVSVSADQNALTDTLLEPEEKQRVQAGETVVFHLDVTNASDTVSEGDRAAVLSEITGPGSSFQIGEYLDITLSKQIGSQPSVPVSDTGSVPVTVVLTVPESLRSPGRIFSIARVHGGVCDVLPDQDGQPDTITVVTNCFSTYAIIYMDPATPTPAPVTPTSAPAGTGPVAPVTGDPSHPGLYGALFLLGLAGLGATQILIKRRKRHKENL